jgi:hypothetical protein
VPQGVFDGLFVVDDEVTWAVPSTDTKPSPTVQWTMPIDAIVSTVKAFEAVELLVGHVDMGAGVGLRTAVEALQGCDGRGDPYQAGPGSGCLGSSSHLFRCFQIRSTAGSRTQSWAMYGSTPFPMSRWRETCGRLPMGMVP